MKFGVRNKYFTYKIEHSLMQINFTQEIFFSYMELKQSYSTYFT